MTSFGFCWNAGSAAGSLGYGKEMGSTLKADGRSIGVLRLNDQGGEKIDISKDVAATLRAQSHGHPPCIYENHAQDSRISGPLENSPTVSRKWGTGGNNTPLVMATGQAGAEIACNLSPFLNCNHEQPIVTHALKAKGSLDFREDSDTLIRIGRYVRRLIPVECERLQGYPDGWTVLPEIQDMADEAYIFWKNLLLEKAIREGKAKATDTGAYEIWRKTKVQNEESEIEDIWENTHRPYKHKTKEQMVRWYNKSFVYDTDTARYTALGNSIALPFWLWLTKRMAKYLPADATLGSLFDGIGGFPLCWETVHGKDTARWASEIEEFPIAVTKKRIG